MSIPWSQSAIREARDQLFLNHADGHRLGGVSANFGVQRPLGIFSDDEWRAVAKAIAFNRKTVRPTMVRALSEYLGPRQGRVGVLRSAVVAGDRVLHMEDSSTLTQQGTIRLDPGTGREESCRFLFRDLKTHDVYLKEPVSGAHPAVASASGFLRSATIIGGTSLPLINSTTFPTSGYPYPLVVDRGRRDHEEAVQVTNNDVATHTLTVSPLAKAHHGPEVDFLRITLLRDAPAKRTILFVSEDDARMLPSTGWLNLWNGGATWELVSFYSVDATDGIVYLDAPLANGFSALDTLELVLPGSLVDTANCYQEPVGWDLWETRPQRVVVEVPESVISMGILDASYLHGAVPAAFSTTLATGSGIGDQVIQVTSASGFPDEAGIITVGGEKAFYLYRDEDAVPPELHLAEPLGSGHLIGATVALVRYPFAGFPSLEDGNFRTAAGAIQFDRFPGGHAYQPSARAPGQTQTTLDRTIPPAAEVSCDQVPGRTCLEVQDASQWDTAWIPLSARVGYGRGTREEATLSAVTLRLGLSTTVKAPGSTAGDFAIPGTDTSGFPVSGGASPAGYRILVDSGGGNEEEVVVSQNAADVFSSIAATTKNHSVGETIELLADVMQFASPLTNPHAGPAVSPTRPGDSVAAAISSIPVPNPAGLTFPGSGGVALLNFGSKWAPARARIAAMTDPQHYVLDSTLAFPVPGSSYPVIVGEGTANEEWLIVTANNTGTATLTFQAPGATLSHAIGQYVAFRPGKAEAVSFESVTASALVLSEPTVLEGLHLEGESIQLSDGFSEWTEDGWSFPFTLPATPNTGALWILDFVRAAGVQVEARRI